ncbi:hypothetical protein Tco_1338661 [Tanacetum coccineum]
MTTSRPTPFPATTPRIGVLILFVIISDSDVEITTLPIRHAPSSSDRISTLSDYLRDSGDDSSNEDLTAPPSTCHPKLPSKIPSLSSPPLSLFPSSSSPSPLLLPSSSRKKPRSPSLPASPSVSPSPLALPPLPSPPSALVPPPPEVAILETLATTAPLRLRRMVEACRWSFASDGIQTWRHQEGEPIYEMGEHSSAEIHPITSEPIHRTIPLLVARLVCHNDQIEEIRDHQREISIGRSESDVRIEILE